MVRQWNDTWPEGSAVIVILEATGKRRPKTSTRLADKHQWDPQFILKTEPLF
ncbi:MAG: hypothetical protein QOK82_00985 [Nitrososphaeraceae archaeon]|nr:hypothetical protein [Nitrososphaeraceae archaeon]